MDAIPQYFREFKGRAVTKEFSGQVLTLRATDPETARVVAVHRQDGGIVGAGCLVDQNFVLSCRHVIGKTFGPQEPDRMPIEGDKVLLSLVGVTDQPTLVSVVHKVGGAGTLNDLVLLRINHDGRLRGVPAVEFASPLRHAGKAFSVLGFPGGQAQGRIATGKLQPADAIGLVQMDRGGSLAVLGGFSGAPVWSPDLQSFVGLVVTELSGQSVSWCIPSRQLCAFFENLRVRFRIPPADRPVINDRTEDDPNLFLFGRAADNGGRALHATVKGKEGDYAVKLVYECKVDSEPPSGQCVTFITYPDFRDDDEDAYELVADLEWNEEAGLWRAEQEIYPGELFTVAAVGDGGRSVLTLDLEEVVERQRKPSKRVVKKTRRNKKSSRSS